MLRLNRLQYKKRVDNVCSDFVMGSLSD